MQSLTTIFFSLTSCLFFFLFFFFHDPPPTGLYTLSLHDALPISGGYPPLRQYLSTYLLRFGLEARPDDILIVKDRKSTRLNSSHLGISYAVFCLKKKKKQNKKAYKKK